MYICADLSWLEKKWDYNFDSGAFWSDDQLRYRPAVSVSMAWVCDLADLFLYWSDVGLIRLNELIP